MGSGVGGAPACSPQWFYADHQLDGRYRCRLSAGDDDGPKLSGVDPQEAVKYQILITLLIGGATGLGVLAATFASVWRLTDNRERLRLDRLAAPRK